MTYFVSRQKYWGIEPEDGTIVEIAQGGRDYANPDMLNTRWANLGEGREFSNPREAVEAAIKVCEAWREAGEKNAQLGMGFTAGSTMPFDPIEYTEAKKLAESVWEKLPKCSHCGELLGKETYTHDMTEEKFCREYCAEQDYINCLILNDETPSNNG